MSRITFAALTPAVLLLAAAAASAAPSLSLARSDPSGDVYEWRASSGATTRDFAYQRVSGHDDIDLVEVRSAASGPDLVLTIRVAGAIREEVGFQSTEGNFSGGGVAYNVALDVGEDDGAEYVVTHAANNTTVQERDGGEAKPVPAEVSGGTLTIRVPTSLLGAMDRFDWAAATIETHTSLSGQAWSSVNYVDVVGMYPGYEAVARLDPASSVSEKAKGLGPGPAEASVALVAAVALGLRFARRP